MILGTFNLHEEKRTLILVVIEADNLARMQKADPISLESLKAGGMMEPIAYPLNTSMLIAYEEDHAKTLQMIQMAPLGMLISWIERGRQFIEGVDGKSFVVPVAGKSAKEQA